MKNDEYSRCGICHAAIPTKHVFSENNQVFLKKEKKKISMEIHDIDEWSPINFQWIPVMALHKNLK